MLGIFTLTIVCYWWFRHEGAIVVDYAFEDFDDSPLIVGAIVMYDVMPLFVWIYLFIRSYT